MNKSSRVVINEDGTQVFPVLWARDDSKNLFIGLDAPTRDFLFANVTKPSEFPLLGFTDLTAEAYMVAVRGVRYNWVWFYAARLVEVLQTIGQGDKIFNELVQTIRNVYHTGYKNDLF